MATQNYLQQPNITDPYTNWFMQSLLPFSYGSPSPKTDWGSIANLGVSSGLSFLQGGQKGIEAIKALQAGTKSASEISGLFKAGTDLSKLSGAKAGLQAGLQSIGGLAGAGNILNTALGFTKMGRQADVKNVGDKILNTAGMLAPMLIGGPIGWGVGTAALINNLAGKTAKKQRLTEFEDTGSAYTGDYVSNLAGKKVSLLGRLFNKKNRRVKGINKTTNIFENILASGRMVGQQSAQELLAAQNSTQNIFEKNQQQLQGGFTDEQLRLLAAKKGAKLYQIKNIVSSAKKSVVAFQQGGKFNVIADGQLHSRKHNMEIDGITNKGVPVVTFEEGGEVQQHAEVEREELIFHKGLTDKIEDLYKRYKVGDKTAAIQAGRILTYEILENTEDNSGIMERI